MRVEMYFFLFRPPLEAHEDELVAGLLWSDPILKDGISPSTRGIGVFFGPDVTKNFLGQLQLTEDTSWSDVKKKL